MTPSAPLETVVETWRDLRAARGRLEKRDRLARLFEALTDPGDLRLAALYLSGELGRPPPGVGGALVGEAFAAVTSSEPLSPPLTLGDVDEAIAALGATAGQGATTRRRELLAALLARATVDQRAFVAGLLLGELRQGALAALVIEGLAKALQLEQKALCRAVMLAGSLGDVVLAARREGAAALASFQLTPLVPVEPMLASTAGPLDATLEGLGGEAAAEWKLDGIRVQVHRRGDDVRVFTRSLRDVTAGMPELVALARRLEVESVVLDGEAVGGAPEQAARGSRGEDRELLPGGQGAPARPVSGLRRTHHTEDVEEAGEPLPFQDLMSRVQQEDPDARGAVHVMFFDVLLLDGRPLVDRPDRERREVLERLLPPALCVPRRLVRDAAGAQAALDDALAHGHEGILLKALDAPYAAGRRGAKWRKLEPAITVDLVILGAEWGHGRREGWLSNLHLGARDADDPGRFWMVGKTFKGLTDAMLRQLTEELPPLVVEQRGHVVRVRPERVVEVAFEGVMRSPRYEGGVALRFARVKRFRPDKRPQEATTLPELRGDA